MIAFNVQHNLSDRMVYSMQKPLPPWVNIRTNYKQKSSSMLSQGCNMSL